MIFVPDGGFLAALVLIYYCRKLRS